MKCAVFIISLLLPQFASADYLLGIGAANLFEKEVEADIYDINPRADYFFGVQNGKSRYVLSYQRDSVETKNGNSVINDKSQEFALWYMRDVFGKENNAWRTLVGLGIGLLWSDVYTSLGSQSVLTTTQKKLMLGASFEIGRKIYKNLWYAFDFQALHSDYFSETTTFEFSLLKLYWSWY